MKINPRYYMKHFGLMLALTIGCIITFTFGWKQSSDIDGMPFARSGALTTALLVAYLVWDYQTRFSKELESIRNLIEKAGNWTAASASTRKDLDKKLIEQFAGTMKLIVWWYSVLLLASTLIWGFGDQFYLNMYDQQLTLLEILAKTLSLKTHSS